MHWATGGYTKTLNAMVRVEIRFCNCVCTLIYIVLYRLLFCMLCLCVFV